MSSVLDSRMQKVVGWPVGFPNVLSVTGRLGMSVDHNIHICLLILRLIFARIFYFPKLFHLESNELWNNSFKALPIGFSIRFSQSFVDTIWKHTNNSPMCALEPSKNCIILETADASPPFSAPASASSTAPLVSEQLYFAVCCYQKRHSVFCNFISTRTTRTLWGKGLQITPLAGGLLSSTVDTIFILILFSQILNHAINWNTHTRARIPKHNVFALLFRWDYSSTLLRRRLYHSAVLLGHNQLRTHQRINDNMDLQLCNILHTFQPNYFIRTQNYPPSSEHCCTVN